MIGDSKELKIDFVKFVINIRFVSQFVKRV